MCLGVSPSDAPLIDYSPQVYGPEEVTSGAMSDIRQATNTASAMVRVRRPPRAQPGIIYLSESPQQFGYSDKIGPVFHHENDVSISPQKREVIEAEIQRYIISSFL